MLKYKSEQYTAYLPGYPRTDPRAYACFKHTKAQFSARANKRNI